MSGQLWVILSNFGRDSFGPADFGQKLLLARSLARFYAARLTKKTLFSKSAGETRIRKRLRVGEQTEVKTLICLQTIDQVGAGEEQVKKGTKTDLWSTALAMNRALLSVRTTPHSENETQDGTNEIKRIFPVPQNYYLIWNSTCCVTMGLETFWGKM